MKQIRQRFIKIALLALTLAMLLVAGVINAVHFVNTSAELKETLDYIVENDNAKAQKKLEKTGVLKEDPTNIDSTQQAIHKGGNHRMDTRLEESRYFIAIRNSSGEIVLGIGSKEAEYSKEELLKIAADVFTSGDESGRTNN